MVGIKPEKGVIWTDIAPVNIAQKVLIGGSAICWYLFCLFQNNITKKAIIWSLILVMWGLLVSFQ